MRLIDADALKEYILRSVPNWSEDREIMLDCLSNSPTIEERKKGKWIEDAETYYRAVNEKGGGVDENTPFFVDDIACPECLTMFSTIENCTELFDYCPHCGADMRGENDGE